MTDFESRFESITETIREAIHQTGNGKTVNLGDMDKKVQKLCADVAKSSNEIKKSLQRPMAEMIARLDELAHGLNEHKERLKESK